VTLTIPAADFTEIVGALNALLRTMQESGALPREQSE
jgi:hypothetical protein